jgi:hypothetical protein
MKRQSSFDRIITDWLAQGPAQLSDHVLTSALTEVHLTRQRRARLAPWRFRTMPRPMKLAAVAIGIVIVVGALAVFLLPKRGDGVAGPAASATPAPSPTLAGSASPAGSFDTSAWPMFTSAQYNFTVRHPSGWTETPATRPWTFATDAKAPTPVSPGMDHFVRADSQLRVSVWSVPLEPGAPVQSWDDVDAWIAAYCEKTGNTPCTGIKDRAVPLCNEHRDCHPGRLVAFQDDVQAFFAGGNYGGMVVVAVWRPEGHRTVAEYGGSTPLLEAFLSTMGVWRPTGPDNHP